MDRRANAEIVASNVSSLILAAGTDVVAVAEATGLTSSELTDRLSGANEFRFSELVRAGGLLRVPAVVLMEGTR